MEHFASQASVDEAWGCIRILERDNLLLKMKVEEQLASREWVKELVQPIKENTAETRRAMEDQRKEMQILSQAHTEAIRQRTEQDKKESEARIEALKSQTWSAIIKEKWAPLLAMIGGGALAVNIIGQLLQVYLQAHGLVLK